ncbi:MAG: TnpV protein [Faecalibacterium sp.]|nr:TnpV protein [Ruminococcus sp.]MCM1392786.1 TnpV protein [Ruminococcus sp.]MCM1485518.1 TnpV protein [Faecalibacterium sp.]
MLLQKHITNEKTGISYTLHGDYYLPDLTLPEEERRLIGIWAQRHLQYIKEHKKAYYTILLTSGKLNSYLSDIDKQAEEMFTMLVGQMAENEGVTEQIKEENQLEWVQQMNNIRSRATEIVNAELIFS